MDRGSSLHVIEASEATARLSAAREWLLARADRGAIIVAASRGAADDLAREVALRSGGAVGLHRFSFAQLAARLAAPRLAARGVVPGGGIAAEVAAARATFDARNDEGLEYFDPVAGTPGFPRKLARTLHEIAAAAVDPDRLRTLPLGGRDLAHLLERFEEQFAAAGVTDRAALFTAAAEATDTLAALPLVMLDVSIETTVEFALARRLVESAPEALLTVPFGDLATLDRLRTLGIEPDVIEPTGPSDLAALRRNLFATRQPPERQRAGDVRLFSAPGEGRECVEIARRILWEARAGIPFDEMAVFVRSPRDYLGLLEDAFDRAGIPGWFERGTRRPHPSGRAFLAILSCAVERLSAVRFAEYLSLSQVPDHTPGPQETAIPPEDLLTGFAAVDAEPDPADRPEADPQLPPELEREAPIVEGTLRAPWMWERQIVEAAVIGGDPARWERRLAGLAATYRQRIREERRNDPDSPKLARLERDLHNLSNLASFALPIIQTLGSWPARGTWGEWLDRFAALAPRVLRKPSRVQRALGELRAMGAIGPVTVEEARDVLSERLRTLEEHVDPHRYGRVFVGTPQLARGRAFKVVFVPGLAERLFPQKPREDPMLLDAEMRQPLDAGLPLQEDRAKVERLLLRLAVGAATEHLWLSYPRLDVGGGRPRVPSFYVLDVMRAITGRIPHHESLQREAAAVANARLDWPAPMEPADAIDDVEHDLATLRELIDAPDAAAVRGQAHYLLQLNDSLRRSMVRRWARARSRWRPEDGLVRAPEPIRATLASQRLGARPYSVSALQKFATCPYQFVLSAIYRLEPNDPPEPLQRLDPLTRGSLFHEVQARFFRALRAGGRLPLTVDGVAPALAILERELAGVAAEQEEELAPAIQQVWRDEIASIGRDLRMWVRKLPEAQGWLPGYFEFSFGLSDEGRDERSVPVPALLDGRFKLRGSVDMIETRDASAELRITDHKTGRNRTTARTVIGGGGTLQPVVYGLAVEQILGRRVSAGRLFYCTAAGGFTEHSVALSDANRRAGLEALEIIDRSIELGFLPAAPADRACTWCDFRGVCGPDEPRHLARKSSDRLTELHALREMP